MIDTSELWADLCKRLSLIIGLVALLCSTYVPLHFTTKSLLVSFINAYPTHTPVHVHQCVLSLSLPLQTRENTHGAETAYVADEYPKRCVCVCMCACVRACMHVRAFMHAHMVRVCMWLHAFTTVTIFQFSGVDVSEWRRRGECGECCPRHPHPVDHLVSVCVWGGGGGSVCVSVCGCECGV